MSGSQGKILVIRGGAIGDFILTLPVLAALREQFPETRLEVLGYPHITELAVAGELVDEARSIESRALAGFFAPCGELDAALREYFAAFSVIISYLYDPDRIFQANVAQCSKAQFIAGPHRPNEAEPAPASEVFLRPLERLAIFGADPVPRLRFRETGASSGAPLERLTGIAEGSANDDPGAIERRDASTRRLAFHPGSGSERKNWPERNWSELLRRVSERDQTRMLMVGGEAEAGRLERLAGSLPPARTELLRSLSLAELGRRLAGSLGFLGHDSGISHLAAAVGVPTIVLWGESVETIWRPSGGHVRVVREPSGLGGISVDRVMAEVERVLG